MTRKDVKPTFSIHSTQGPVEHFDIRLLDSRKIEKYMYIVVLAPLLRYCAWDESSEATESEGIIVEIVRMIRAV